MATAVQFKLGNITVNNGESTATISGITNEFFDRGTALFVSGAALPVEATRGSGTSQLSLINAWPFSSVSNQPFVAFNTIEGLAEANRLVGWVAEQLIAILEGTSEFSTNLLGQTNASGWRGALGLGSAATASVTTSATDATAGRLLKVGDFGFPRTVTGNALFDSDFNTLVPHAINVTTVGVWQNGPLGNVTHTGVLYQSPRREFNNMMVQTWVGQVAAGGAYRKFERQIQSNLDPEDWPDWVELLHAGNILGTASQSGGVPTGAIIQRGSNANGEFVRFADGTQICTTSITSIDGANTASGNIFISSPTTWTLPASFLSTSNLSVSCGVRTSGAVWGQARLLNTSSVDLRLYATVSNATPRVFDAVAIGRWY